MFLFSTQARRRNRRITWIPNSPDGWRASAGRAVILTAGVLLASVTAPSAQADPPPLNVGPTIRLEDRTWNFGQLPQYSQATHRFIFRNDGTAPLRILKVDVDCGCTAVAPEDSILAPGESSALEVTFSSRTYEGAQRKVVALFTNDPAEPRIDLLIQGDVKPFIQVEPRLLDFGLVRRGDTKSLFTLLTSEDDSGFQATGVDGGEEYVDWKIENTSPARGQAYRVTAALKSDAPLGAFNRRIVVKVEHPKVPYERIFIKGTVYSYFFFREGGINFSTIKTGRLITREFRIEAPGGKPYKITGASATVQFIKPSVKEDGDGYQLTVVLEAPKQGGRFREQIILTTTDPEEPELKIEARGVILE